MSLVSYERRTLLVGLLLGVLLGMLHITTTVAPDADDVDADSAGRPRADGSLDPVGGSTLTDVVRLLRNSMRAGVGIYDLVHAAGVKAGEMTQNEMAVGRSISAGMGDGQVVSLRTLSSEVITSALVRPAKGVFCKVHAMGVTDIVRGWSDAKRLGDEGGLLAAKVLGEGHVKLPGGMPPCEVVRVGLCQLPLLPGAERIQLLRGLLAFGPRLGYGNILYQGLKPDNLRVDLEAAVQEWAKWSGENETKGFVPLAPVGQLWLPTVTEGAINALVRSQGMVMTPDVASEFEAVVPHRDQFPQALRAAPLPQVVLGGYRELGSLKGDQVSPGCARFNVYQPLSFGMLNARQSGMVDGLVTMELAEMEVVRSLDVASPSKRLKRADDDAGAAASPVSSEMVGAKRQQIVQRVTQVFGSIKKDWGRRNTCRGITGAIARALQGLTPATLAELATR